MKNDRQLEKSTNAMIKMKNYQNQASRKTNKNLGNHFLKLRGHLYMTSRDTPSAGHFTFYMSSPLT